MKPSLLRRSGYEGRTKIQGTGCNMSEQELVRQRVADAEHYKEITGGEQIPERFFGEADKIGPRKTTRTCQPQIPYYKDKGKALPKHERLGKQGRIRP